MFSLVNKEKHLEIKQKCSINEYDTWQAKKTVIATWFCQNVEKMQMLYRTLNDKLL